MTSAHGCAVGPRAPGGGGAEGWGGETGHTPRQKHRRASESLCSGVSPAQFVPSSSTSLKFCASSASPMLMVSILRFLTLTCLFLVTMVGSVCLVLQASFLPLMWTLEK